MKLVLFKEKKWLHPSIHLFIENMNCNYTGMRLHYNIHIHMAVVSVMLRGGTHRRAHSLAIVSLGVCRQEGTWWGEERERERERERESSGHPPPPAQPPQEQTGSVVPAWWSVHELPGCHLVAHIWQRGSPSPGAIVWQIDRQTDR